MENDLAALRRIVSDGLCAVAERLCPDQMEKGGELRSLGLWGYYLRAASTEHEPAVVAMHQKLADWSANIATSGVLDATAGEHLPPLDVTEGVEVDLRPLLAKAAQVDSKEASARVWGYIGSIVQRFASAEEHRQKGHACCEKVQAFLGEQAAGNGPATQDNAKAFLGSLVNHLLPTTAGAFNGGGDPSSVTANLIESGHFSHVFGALMTGMQSGSLDMPSLLRTAADIMANPSALGDLVNPEALRQAQAQAQPGPGPGPA